MTNQKLVEWAQKKLEEGMDEQRVREALEKSGRDPSIVDKAKNQDASSNEPERTEKPQRKENRENEQDQRNLHSHDKEKKEGSESSLAEKLPSIQTKRFFSRFLTGFRSNLKILGILIVFLTVISGGWVLASSGVLNSLIAAETDQNLTQNTVSGAQETPEYSQPAVILNEGVAEPGRAKISSNEELTFVNNLTYTLQVEFETGNRDFRLKPGETKKMGFNTLVYYDARPVNTDEGEQISGSVFVQ